MILINDPIVFFFFFFDQLEIFFSWKVLITEHQVIFVLLTTASFLILVFVLCLFSSFSCCSKCWCFGLCVNSSWLFVCIVYIICVCVSRENYGVGTVRELGVICVKKENKSKEWKKRALDFDGCGKSKLTRGLQCLFQFPSNPHELWSKTNNLCFYKPSTNKRYRANGETILRFLSHSF